jgi:NADPH:quinone reductase-like Zn-dependent oxidoreductase
VKAIVTNGEGPTGVVVAEVEEPRAGAGEALIAVEAFSVNRGETFQIESRPAGFRPGKDMAGVVVRAAADGSGPGAGERVVAHAAGAGWAERVAVPTDRLATHILTATTAAALPLAGLTALRLTRATGPLASRRVLLTGASGGVGHYFVELAAAQGAELTAVSASVERAARLLDLGAARVVAEVEEAEGPFDLALDSVGGASTPAAFAKLTARGSLVWFGQASRVAPSFDFFDWRGAFDGTIRRFHYEESDVSFATDLATLVRLTAGGRLHPEVGFTAPWGRTDEALAALLAREVRGNAVLTVGEPAAPAELATTRQGEKP